MATGILPKRSPSGKTQERHSTALTPLRDERDNAGVPQGILNLIEARLKTFGMTHPKIAYFDAVLDAFTRARALTEVLGQAFDGDCAAPASNEDVAIFTSVIGEELAVARRLFIAFDRLDTEPVTPQTN
jgi:hypothetical protein